MEGKGIAAHYHSGEGIQKDPDSVLEKCQSNVK